MRIYNQLKGDPQFLGHEDRCFYFLLGHSWDLGIESLFFFFSAHDDNLFLSVVNICTMLIQALGV